MKDLIDVATQIQELFEERGWRFCFIGGLAVQHWGEPRVTLDVDVSLFMGFGEEEAFVEELLILFEARVENCLDFALRNRVVLLKAERNIGIDIALAGLPFEETVINRAVRIAMLPGKQLVLCTAEDLIVLKAFAARAIDWHDVESIVARQGSSNLDWSHINSQLAPLAEVKEEPEIMERLNRIQEG